MSESDDGDGGGDRSDKLIQFDKSQPPAKPLDGQVVKGAAREPAGPALPLPSVGVVARKQVTTTTVSAQTFSGPLPHPDVLAGYGQIDPSFPGRIVKMAEDQAQHRRDLEKIALNGALSSDKLGVFAGVAMGLALAAASLIMVLYGHDTAGGVVGGSTLVAVVGAFVYRERQQKKASDHERALAERKNPQLLAGKANGGKAKKKKKNRK